MYLYINKGIGWGLSERCGLDVGLELLKGGVGPKLV